MAYYFGRQNGLRAQAAGLRCGAMFFWQMQSISHRETVHNQLQSHRLKYAVLPVPDVPGSQQPMQLLAYTKDMNKTATGETRSVTRIARH